MTRSEKAKAIANYCENRPRCNVEPVCPLAEIGCINIDNADRNYDILVKAGLIAPDDEIETADDKVDEAHKRFMSIGETDNAVHSPTHYTRGGIECIDAIKASMASDGFCDYCKGNVIKYLWRWRDKGGVQDLEKAKVYLEWLIKTAKGERK